MILTTTLNLQSLNKKSCSFILIYFIFITHLEHFIHTLHLKDKIRFIYLFYVSFIQYSVDPNLIVKNYKHIKPI